jgi:hypothetical protein
MPDCRAHGAYCRTQRGPLGLVLYGTGTVSLGAVVLTAAAVAGLVRRGLPTLAGGRRGDALSIRFGPLPLFSKAVRYAEVVTVEVGRSGRLDRWGVHWSPRGG